MKQLKRHCRSVMRQLVKRLGPVSAIAFVSALNLTLASHHAHAQAGPDCSATYRIDETLPNGSRWEMCWEPRDREGIVLNDVYYTTATGVRRKVLAQANIAQIHVPYDDNGARFHDVSDYGLGAPDILNDLARKDCPDGSLIKEGVKDVICKRIEKRGHAFADDIDQLQGDALLLFSVSHVGAYNYIPEWRFFDDGTIEPSMGATGSLQRYGAYSEYGWTVRPGLNPVGISHLHNYYWRLDFDLGESATDETFEEINFTAQNDSTQRVRTVTSFSSETARSVRPNRMRSWRVKDNTIKNEAGRPVSYEIISLETGHRDTGPSYEPWTFKDIYVTRHRGCEKFISHNPADILGGCSVNGDVSDFVDGESLVGADLVVWFGLSFHHIPRDEDEPYMNAHWNRFQIVPRDWTDDNPLYVGDPANTAPSVVNPGDQTTTVGEAVSLGISASDGNGDTLNYSAAGLPAGLTIDETTGQMGGTPTAVGTYAVTVTVDDGQDSTDTAFSWVINAAPPLNQPPTVVNPGDQTTTVGEAVSLGISASDGNGDTLNYSAAGLPVGLTIDTLTGQMGGTPTAVGTYAVTVTVGDGQDSTDIAFSWVINAAPPLNQPPTIVNPGDQTTAVGNAVSLGISASDAEGDTLNYSAAGLPVGLTIDETSGQMGGTPTAVGTYAVTVTVDDGQDSAGTAFSWVIQTTGPSAGPKLHYGVISGIGDQWQTVQLPQSYDNIVVIASVRMQDGLAPAITRVRNAQGAQFELRVQNPSETPLSGYAVHYVVAEAGVYTAATDGIKMEAQRFSSTVTDRTSSWVGEAVSYANSYEQPVVLGQVMSANSADWSVFWARGAGRSQPPSPTQLFIGKHVGEDSNTTRVDETLGYIVVEAGTGTLGDLTYEAAVSADIVKGVTNTPPYTVNLSRQMAAAVVSTSGLDGGGGGWPVLWGDAPLGGGQLSVAYDEDQISDTERNHTTEQLSYLVFTSNNGPGPKLYTGIVENVGDSWQTVSVPKSYNEMVVVASVQYPSTDSLPAVPRIRNVASDRFEVRIQNPSGDSLSGYKIHFVTVEAGVYNATRDGVTMEARRTTSTLTDYRGSWLAQEQTFANTYTAPVVIGQVMSADDPDWSVFWARGSDQWTPPSASSLYVGKHVGEDSDTSRGNDTIGYIVIEAGIGALDGLGYEAGITGDFIKGVGNAPPFNVILSAQMATAIVSASSGMNRSNGGWPVLWGSDPLAGGQLALAFDEDQVADSERNHATEQVGYVVFGSGN